MFAEALKKWKIYSCPKNRRGKKLLAEAALGDKQKTQRGGGWFAAHQMSWNAAFIVIWMIFPDWDGTSQDNTPHYMVEVRRWVKNTFSFWVDVDEKKKKSALVFNSLKSAFWHDVLHKRPFSVGKQFVIHVLVWKLLFRDLLFCLSVHFCYGFTDKWSCFVKWKWKVHVGRNNMMFLSCILCFGSVKKKKNTNIFLGWKTGKQDSIPHRAHQSYQHS